jgi:hypothetical protein
MPQEVADTMVAVRVHTAMRSRSISLSLSATTALLVSSGSREAFAFLAGDMRSEVHIGGRAEPRVGEGAPAQCNIIQIVAETQMSPWWLRVHTYDLLRVLPQVLVLLTCCGDLVVIVALIGLFAFIQRALKD